MTQKYRPRTFGEVVGQPTERVEALLNGRDTPNFLFHGPPGTGKTSTAYLISEALQGDRAEMMEFNASDDRGIGTVRNRIIPATDQTTLTGAPRVIFLDEMDSMTKDAQQALRQPMEQSDAVFVLACNDLSAVHDAVTSRCQVFEFGEVGSSAIKKRIRQIADAEGVEVSDDQLKVVSSFANGDMRQAIQRYQQIANGADDTPDQSVVTDGNTLEAEAQQFLEGD